MNYKANHSISKHTVICFLIFVIASAFSFADTDVDSLLGSSSKFVELTAEESIAIDDLNAFRVQCGLFKTCAEAVDAIEEYTKKINEPEYSKNLSGDIKLSINNVLIWEKYNYLYEKDIACPELKELITTQYATVKKWFKESKDKPHNKWLYVTSADILSCCMQFLPVTTAMNEGITVKKYYDVALKIDPDMVYCLIDIAQWYFYAPAFAGGSHKKAQQCLEHSLEVSSSIPEKLNSLVLLSQVLYDDGKKDEAAKYLQQAGELVPGARVVRNYKYLNETCGVSYFDYTMNRKKIDAKYNITAE